MSRFAGATHALLRIVAGFLFIHPGGMKILGWFGGMPAGVPMTPLLTAAVFGPRAARNASRSTPPSVADGIVIVR